LLQIFYTLGVIRSAKHTHHKFKSVSDRLGEIRVRIVRVQAWYGVCSCGQGARSRRWEFSST